MKTISTSFLHATGFICLAVSALFWTGLEVKAQDYTITTTAGNLAITDNTGGSETLTVDQNGTNIRFANSNTARTYSIDGGANTAFTTLAQVTLSGLASVTINAQGGDDIITLLAFTSNLPSLTINGGTGNDVVNFNGDITFASNANLDLDMQNDHATPGTDAIAFAANADLLLQGTGSVTIKVSHRLQMSNSASTLKAANGNITIETNQQVTPISGSYSGLEIYTNSSIEITGTGILYIKCKGGTSTFSNLGISAQAGGKITGGTSGNNYVEGIGGSGSNATNNSGLGLNNATTRISTNGGNLTVAGTGGSSGTGSSCQGIGFANGATISTTGSGILTVTGTAGLGSGTTNDGIGLYVGTISSAGGNITVTGTKSPNSTTSADIIIAGGSGITSTGSFGNITVTGTSGGVWPNLSGTEINTGSARTISFGSSSKLNIDIDGTTLNSQYKQLTVAGLLNLNGAELTFTGSTYTPVSGNSFIIVSNDGCDAITGTFNGLAQYTVINNFLGSSQNAYITYTGGTGNDVAIIIGTPPVLITWDGSSSSDWNTAANWNTNAVPSATDNVSIPDLSNDPVISGAVTVNNIDLQGGTPLIIANGGSLTLNGTLANAGQVTVQSGGSFLQDPSCSSITGSGTFTVQRQGTSSPTRFNYWSTPVSGGTLPGSNGYRYNSAAGTNSNSDDSPADPGWVSHSGAMTTGLGYASMGGGLASFAGTPNNGTINIPVTYYGLSPTSTSPNSDFVHLGNPYPSGLTVNTFLTGNAARLSGQLWAWDDDNSNGVDYTTSDYASRTTAGSISGGNGNSISAQIATCQGFVVKAISSGNVVFQNTQRNAAAGTFLKTEEETSRIWLSLSNDTLYNEINVVFMDGATTEFDHMLDGLKLRANPAIAFAVNPDGNTAEENELCIAALPPVTEETIVTLTTFVAGEGVYTIRNKEVENMDNMDVYLEDRLTGTFTNLANNGEYSTLMNIQNTENRFFLHFGTLATAIAEQTAPSFRAYANGDELTLFINSSAISGIVEKLTLTDMAGRIIFSEQDVKQQGNFYKTNVPGLAQGIYVVSLQTANNTFSNKISVR